MTNPDTRTTSSAPGSIAPRRSRLESLARRAVGAAWTATGPVRWGAGIALRTTEVVVSEVAMRVSPRPADPAVGRPDAAPGGPDPAPGSSHTSSELLDRLVGVVRPVIDSVVRVALGGLDLTAVVLDGVDLDAVVAAVDLDGAVARVDLDRIVDRVDVGRILDRLDLDAIVERVDLNRIVERLDLDLIVERVDLDRIVGRLDLDAIVERVNIEQIIGRLDLDQIVEGVDLDRIVNRLDLDVIVDRVDIDRIINRLDLAAIVARVDPDPIVARVDFDAAIGHIDLIAIATEVVDGIDLAGIIRDSTGSLASEAVHGVRVQGQQADDAIGQFVGRMLGRRRHPEGGPQDQGTVQNGRAPDNIGLPPNGRVRDATAGIDDATTAAVVPVLDRGAPTEHAARPDGSRPR